MKLVNLAAPGEGIKISKAKGFTYTKHKFSFYEHIQNRRENGK